MVTYLKNKYGDIITFIEWWKVDNQGKMKQGGEYLYIHDYYCCPRYRNRNKYLKKLIRLIMPRVQEDCKYVYWCRKKYKGRKSIYLLDNFKRK